MGTITPPNPVLRLLAAFSRHDEALAWAGERTQEAWGDVLHESPRFDFDQTDYYEASMGEALKKVFWVFADPVDPGEVVDWKLATNAWEGEYTATGRHAEPRPLNLDPGYLDLGKLVLASTKDHAHRIYLDRGIYAEVTLNFRLGRWHAHRWTFADYRRDDYHRFFSQCRETLRAIRRERGTTR